MQGLIQFLDIVYIKTFQSGFISGLILIILSLTKWRAQIT